MANTLTLNTVTQKRQGFQGLFTHMWEVKATVADQDAIALTDTLVLTMAVPGVELGDAVLFFSLTVDQSDGTDQAISQCMVTAANVVSIYILADKGELAADALNTGVLKLVVGRFSW